MVEKAHRENVLKSPIPEETRAHFMTARQELRNSIVSLLPPEFVEHSTKARKEMLLAWRSIIDAAIRRIEEKESV
jgi:hypothetical protein